MEASEEKKVEYIELIYDLIFVYLVGRNNALLHTLEGGFFSANTFFTYVISTLVILQVWYFSTLFINRYGGSTVSDHVGIFINMYLLYYMGNGTRGDWFGYYVSYNAAWGLILVNLACQYLRKLRRSGGIMPWEDRHLKYHIRLLLIQALLIFASIPLYNLTHRAFSWVVLVVGFLAAALTERINALVPVNFEHLTERVMLYVVFTFGEMVVGIAEYFEGEFGLSTVYFSLMAFLIVAGLFLSYGFLYNRVTDREFHTTGTVYMWLHILLILALNNLTVALEFMRMPEVREGAKNIFLVVSFLLYYLVILSLSLFAKEPYRVTPRALPRLGAMAAAFAGAMAFCYRNGWVSIAVSVLYVYAVLFALYRHWKRAGRKSQL